MCLISVGLRATPGQLPRSYCWLWGLGVWGFGGSVAGDGPGQGIRGVGAGSHKFDRWASQAMSEDRAWDWTIIEMGICDEKGTRGQSLQ